MSNFSLGFKSQIINSADQNIARFFKLKANGNGYDLVGTSKDYSGDPAVADTPANKIVNADRVVIDGFVTLDKGKIKNAIGAKGVPSQKPEVVLTFAVAGVTEISEFSVNLKLTSPNFDSEFARWDANFERTFIYPLIVKPGDSPADVIARLKGSLEADNFQYRPYFTIVADDATTITLTTTSDAWGIVPTSEGAVIDEGKVTITPTVSKIGYEGRNNFDTLKGFRVETEATLQPLNPNDIQRQGLPVPGALYTSITFEKDVDRPELSGSAMANGTVFGDFAFQLFVNQSLTTYLAALTSWVNKNVAVRSAYPATTAAQATTSPETVNSYTTVATAPFTAGLN
jgi:hypothetical protein